MAAEEVVLRAASLMSSEEIIDLGMQEAIDQNLMEENEGMVRITKAGKEVALSLEKDDEVLQALAFFAALAIARFARRN